MTSHFHHPIRSFCETDGSVVLEYSKEKEISFFLSVMSFNQLFLCQNSVPTPFP